MTAALQQQNIERRVREYKSDTVIKGLKEIMFKIYCYAQPRILVCSNFEKSIFDIDPESKERIQWLEKELKNYIRSNYSDIITVE